MKKLIVVLAIIALAAPAAFADVDLYGSARMWTYSASTDDVDYTTADEDDTNTVWSLGPFSRFGATFKNGDVGGKFELDGRMTANKSASSVGSMRIRHLYGTWNFGSGELLVGQTWPITDQPIAGLQFSGDGLQSYGGVGAVDARIPQLRLTFGAFKIGLLSPDVYQGLSGIGAGTDPGNILAPVTGDIDPTLPKIEASYDLGLGDVGSLTFFGGYQTYDVEAIGGGNDSDSVTAYVAGVKAKFNFGPAYLNAIVDYGLNPTNYGEAMGSGVSGEAAWDGDSVIDYKNMGAALAVGFKANDMFTLEAGYGMDKGEWDATDAPEQDHSAYYVKAIITLAPGVLLCPEYAKFDYGDTDIGNDSYDDGGSDAIGAVWYINF